MTHMSSDEIIAELPRLSAVELARVQAKLKELVDATPATAQTNRPLPHPALGMWKDRTDLPDDPVEACKLLRERMTRRGDTAG